MHWGGKEITQTVGVKEEQKPLGLVWVDCCQPIVASGLRQALEDNARVHVGNDLPDDVPSCVVHCVEDTDDLGDLAENIRRIRATYAEAYVLIFGPRVDLPLARSALRAGARGYIHAEMQPEQVARAVGVAAEGEIVAPRKLLEYMVSEDRPGDVEGLSARQREILKHVVEGASNAEIARRLYVSESTVKQHLRNAYKVLGVKNRTEAAKLLRGR